MSQPRSGVRQTLKKAGTQFTHIFRKDENVAKTDTNRSTDGKPTLSDTPAQDVASTPKSSTNARPDSSGTELGHVPTLPPTQLGTTAAPDPQIQKDKSSNDADASDPVTTAGDPGALPNVGTIASAKASITLTSASATAETEKTTTIDGAEVVGTPNVDTTTPVTAINDVATGGHSTTSWTSKRTPLWNEAIGKWKETPKGQAECKEVESLMADASSKSIETAGFLSQLQPEAQSSSKWRLRLKRCEPIINATRGIAVTLANTDPHKVAPLIVHSVFAGINILFNRMTPENTDKVLDILFGCSDIIRECVTFELYFTQKNNPVVEDDMNAIRKALPVLYLRALRLMYEIQSSCKSVEHHYENSREKWLDWIKTRGMLLSKF
ncbi:hypothetical protein BDV96DRAFT_189746 [Lophiotrema nucula]|uniref:Uncharacterized protein n=1 Tax=Lophiotrema nucula TaxID=690887 RepID=A0A6A5YWD5_9PLEO|nr:hypothetical protein BDV96DRAFT_189746 [Lophiotrema nucula]